MPIQNILLLLAFLTLVSSGCRKELTPDNTDKQFPIHLEYQRDGDIITFHWDLSTRFGSIDRCLLVRSNTPIDTGNNPAHPQVTSIFDTKNREENTFREASSILLPESFYKLYVQIEGRWIESQLVTIKNTFFTIPGGYISARFLPDSNWMLLIKAQHFFDNGVAALIDYRQHKIISTFQLSEQNLSAGFLGLDLSNHSSSPEAWIYTASNCQRFQLPGLQLISESGPTVGLPYAVTTGGSGLVFTTKMYYEEALSIFNRQLQLVQSHSRPFFSINRNLLVLDTATNLIAEIADAGISTYTVDPTGSTLTQKSSINLWTGPFQLLGNHVPATSDLKYFCPCKTGVIYDHLLNTVAAFPPSGLNEIYDVTFSRDSRFFYTLTKAIGFEQNPFQIVKYTFPDLEPVDSFPLRDGNYERIQSTQNPNELIIVASPLDSIATFVRTIIL